MVFEAHCMSFPYRTLIIQLCQDKHSFPFYGTFKKNMVACLGNLTSNFVSLFMFAVFSNALIDTLSARS